MASFDLIFPMVLKFEGGYVDDPEDPGGETNKGITMAVFQECAHELLGLDPTSDNLKGLTDAQAGIIYRSRYWNKMLGDSFQLQDLAGIIFDFYVNSGTHATALLQRILDGLGATLVVDGLVGPGTLQALGGFDSVAVYRLYKQQRMAYYQQLVVDKPNLAKFLNGWLNRVQAFPTL
jgi:lysozyme family protein